MNNATNLNETNAHVERLWVAALSNEHIGSLMHATPSDDERVVYGKDASTIMTISKSEIEGLISE